MNRLHFKIHLRKLGSQFEGFRARDWLWLKNWRIGREKGMNGPVDVEDVKQCHAWITEVYEHADTFLNTYDAGRFIEESNEKLVRHRSELADGRRS